MRAIIQRVQSASVQVDRQTVGRISYGLLVFLGVEKSDDRTTTTRMIDKIVKYRIFNDNNFRMNHSLSEIQGDLLLVSQFTLMADTDRGLRPGFSKAAIPEKAKPLYDFAIEYAEKNYPECEVQQGIFGADMQIQLINDGPVTFILECH